MGEGGYYIGLTGYVEQFAALLQAQPFHGTFNLQLAEDVYDRFKMAKKTFLPKLVKGFTSENRTFGDVVCYFGFIWPQGRKSQMRRCLLLDIERTSHKPGIIEIVAIENFRTQWECQDGDAFEIIFDTTQKSLPQ
jgi:CTP-dependent riboflavin kinase